MGIRFVTAGLCLAAALFAGAPARAQDAPAPRAAGTIELAEGDILIESKEGKTRLPDVGASVYEGDTLTTFRDAELQLHMADGASMILRENSKITIAAYVADGGADDRSLIELAKGALRSITGWIGQYNRSNYAIRTPLVTIGVRGTDHEPTHLLAGDPRGEPGTYDKVNEGSAFMQTKEGVVEVPASRAAFRPSAHAARPRLLGTVPVFFRPGRHEQRFVARAHELRKSLVQRRLERRELVRQRLPAGGARQLRPEPPRKALPQARERAREVRKAERPRAAPERRQRPGGGAKRHRPGEKRR
jgi:hypothetical protein